MIAKVIAMSNSSPMALFPFPASMPLIVSITTESNGLMLQFSHAQRRETLPLKEQGLIQCALLFVNEGEMRCKVFFCNKTPYCLN